MKILKHITNIIIWTVLGLYLLVILLFNIPSIQGFIGSQVASALSEKLGTRVSIGNVDVGLLNRLIIDDVLIYDQQQKKMVKSARMSVKIDIMPLTEGKISISSAQLFGAHINLYQASAQAKPNFQFVLDSLASKDTTSHTPLNLRINSLIIRHSSVSFNRYDIAPTHDRLNMAHLNIKDISAHILLKALKNDSMNINIKKLSFHEQSGLQVNKLSLKFEGGKNKGRLHDLNLKMPGTNIVIDNIVATYKSDKQKIIPATLRYHGKIGLSNITLSDIACLLPSLKTFNSTLTLSSVFNGTSTNLQISKLKVESTTGDLSINANGWIKDWKHKPLWSARINNLNLSAKTIDFISQNLKGNKIKVPEVLTRMGGIQIQGRLNSSENKSLIAKCQMTSDVGIVDFAFSLAKDKSFVGNIDTEGVNLKQLLANDKLGMIATNIDARGTIPDRGKPSIMAKGIISRFDYNNYKFNNIAIDGSYDKEHISGKLNINDPNINIDAEGTVKRIAKASNIKLKATVRTFAPSAVNISNQWGDAKFSANIDADFVASDMNDAKGTLDIANLHMQSSKDNYSLEQMSIKSGFYEGKHYLIMNSDFGHAELFGHFEYNTLAQSFTNFIGSKLPTLPGLPKRNMEANNDFIVNANIDNTDWLEKFFKVPLLLHKPIVLNAKIDDKAKDIELNCDMPYFVYSGKAYRKGRVIITSPNDTLHCDVSLTKIMDNGDNLDLRVIGNAIDNNLATSVIWNNNTEEKLSGKFNAITQFFRNLDGKQAAHIGIQPSHININNTIWDVKPSDITYTKNHIDVDNFAIMHNQQHIIINGTASKSLSDSLLVDLRGIDVKYILDLVNFHAVEFSGRATGRAYISAPFGDLAAHGKIMVNHFKFEQGRMGVLDADVNWNNKDKQIDINAFADDGPGTMTFINGYVSPARDYIDLGIRAAGTNIEFMKTFTSSFMEDVSGKANGELRLSGPLSTINLTGKLVLNGDVSVRTLNCKYELRNDTINFIPDEIELRNTPIYDRNNNRGVINGNIHHKHLTRLSYDLLVNANNLLAYDFQDFGDETFCGTIYGSGEVGIHGQSGELNIDVNVTPQKNSTFLYNVSNPDAIANQEFIHWNDMTNIVDTLQTTANGKAIHTDDDDMPSDTYIKFLINCTPDATIKLLMDSKTNDYITLNGNGTIQASYYNKGSFNMFGTYVVERGTYGITIQNILKKNFVFNEGGTIVFGGNPYDATLNLQAVHTVNGVSLSDLNVGNSFSNNSTRVNCLMNITGQPRKPAINFDLDMPTMSSDEKQMIRSIINSEDEMNQQVLYLLGIGRFYPQGNNNATAQSETQQSQTSLAMQSLLSGTISGQINNVLNTVIKSNDWNFGANISTGDEGWNNAEYEGLLSGRLLNNRLLINGQFGYRDNTNTANTSFIGDFDIRYLIFPNGNLAVKVYNQTNDRYFTKSSLNTQGVGLIMKKDFNGIRDLFNIKKKPNKRHRK